MKKTILIALTVIFATSTVIAQDFEQREDRHGPSPEKRIEHQIKRLDKNLKLNDEQQKQLKNFYNEFDKARQARMEQMRQMEKRDREALDVKIKSILTEEQKVKYDQMKEKEKEMWKNGGEAPRRGEFGREPGRGGMNHMRHGSRGMGQHGENMNLDE